MYITTAHSLTSKPGQAYKYRWYL